MAVCIRPLVMYMQSYGEMEGRLQSARRLAIDLCQLTMRARAGFVSTRP
jgi:hypothetical protein